jgi:hypothetical protein
MLSRALPALLCADETPILCADETPMLSADAMPGTLLPVAGVLPMKCRVLPMTCRLHVIRYYSLVLAWQKEREARSHEIVKHQPFYITGTREDLRSVVRSLPLETRTLTRTFEASYPDSWLDELKKGVLGNHPENRRGDVILCVDHCKGQGELAGGGFTLNICDTQSHELLHQEVVASDDLAAMTMALKEVASLPFLKDRIAVVYYDKVTAKSQELIKRATGARFVLQDPWHVANRINAACNNRVGGDAYNAHVRAVSNALYKLNFNSVEEIKLALWTRRLESCLQLPSGSSLKRTKFQDLTDRQIFDYLMCPPGYKSGDPSSLPAVSKDPATMRAELQQFTLLPKFYETFKMNLRKDLRPVEEMKAKLIEVYWKFRDTEVNGRALYPHKYRMYLRFRNALKRCDFMVDPPGIDIYHSVGEHMNPSSVGSAARFTDSFYFRHGRQECQGSP